MDMVNDGKDIRLDTPQAVKEALASGKDLYNPETGEFWWEYNYTGSIANTYVHLDDPNLLAVIDNPDFDLFEDIVGGLSYTGYINDSIETIISKTVSRSNASLEDTQSLIDSRVVEQCVGLMARADSMTFFGVGASLLVAKDAFFKFIRVKKHCQISDDFDLQLVMAKTMTPSDVAVLISYSGKTKATVDCAKQLKANGVPVIAITCFVESELSKLADYNLYVSATEYEFTSGKFTSRLSQLLVIDILYLAYIQATYSTSQTALIATHIDKRDKGEAEDGEAEFECIDDGDA